MGRPASTLTGLATEQGFGTFVFWPPDNAAVQVERFGDVAPAVRAAVARVRPAGRPPDG